MSLTDILKANYYELGSEEDKEAVLQFIYQTPSVEGRDPIFIKLLTKVASHILKSNSAKLADYLERLFKFNQEGILEVQKDRDSGMNLKGHDTIISHFHAYAGDVAYLFAISKTEVNKEWLKRAYDEYVTSYHTGMVADPVHAAYAKEIAGDMGKKLFNATQEKALMGLVYDHFIEAGHLLTEINPSRAAVVFDRAGGFAKSVHSHKKGLKWAIKCYEAKNLAVKWFSNTERKLIAKKDVFFIIRDICDFQDNNLEWLIKGYAVGEEIISDLDPSDSIGIAKYLGRLGEIAKNAYLVSDKDIAWAKKWYEKNVEAGELAMPNTEKFAAVSFVHAAEAAQELCVRTNNIEWAKKALDNFFKAGEYSQDAFVHSNRVKAYSEAGLYARIVFDATKDWDLIVKLYTSYAKAGLIGLKHNVSKKRTCIALAFAADAARKLFRHTNDPCWGKRALLCYSHPLKYIQSNAELEGRDNVITQIKLNMAFIYRDVKRLESKI